MTESIHLDVLGLVFFTALSLSLFIVPATVILARKVGAVDIPKDRSSHSIPTTRLGGLGIAASLVLACLMFLPLNSFAWAFLTGLLIIVATGLVDDITDIGPRWKFVGQAVAASAFVALGGGSLDHLGDFLGGDGIRLGFFAAPFTVFCMVGGINAFNLSDGLDGLAGGLAAIAVVFFAYFSWHAGAPDLLLVCVALLGALIGFLRYNSYPSKLFMGDCGSLSLGYVLVALLVSGSQRAEGHVPLVGWALVLALPLIDTLLVMARRMYYGQSPFMPDRTHLHHRLMALGLAHPGVVAVMYAAMAFFGALALGLQNYPDWIEFAALCMAGGVLFGGVSGLQHVGFSFLAGRRKRPYSTVRQWPMFIRFSQWVGSKAVPVSVLLLSLLCLPALFFPLPSLNGNEVLALLMLSGVVIFYSQHQTDAYKGVLHGSIYVSIFVLFFLYNLSVLTDGRWPVFYLTTISVLTAVWVAIKVFFRKHTAILKTSSFELLMVFLSWFLPFVLFQELHLPVDVEAAGRLACLQVLPFMLSAKIYFTVQPRGNRWVVGVLAGAMVIVALRGWAW
jgi:UDP-GlcNAc:undecaprenyl-phosphate GlcNAc-1-phosphate transferase